MYLRIAPARLLTRRNYHPERPAPCDAPGRTSPSTTYTPAFSLTAMDASWQPDARETTWLKGTSRFDYTVIVVLCRHRTENTGAKRRATTCTTATSDHLSACVSDHLSASHPSAPMRMQSCLHSSGALSRSQAPTHTCVRSLIHACGRSRAVYEPAPRGSNHNMFGPGIRLIAASQQMQFQQALGAERNPTITMG